MCAWRLTSWSFLDGLPEMSNCYCHPGKAGGTPGWIRLITINTGENNLTGLTKSPESTRFPMNSGLLTTWRNPFGSSWPIPAPSLRIEGQRTCNFSGMAMGLSGVSSGAIRNPHAWQIAVSFSNSGMYTNWSRRELHRPHRSGIFRSCLINAAPKASMTKCEASIASVPSTLVTSAA
jgi:hypothetical protein